MKFLRRIQHRLINIGAFGEKGYKRIEKIVSQIELKNYRKEQNSKLAY